MRRNRLVLLKWGDDVIAAHTTQGDGSATVDRIASSASEADGVSVEVHDVEFDRAEVRAATKPEGVAVFGILTSLAVHVTIASALFIVATFGPAAASADDQAATRLRSMQVEANENAEGQGEREGAQRGHLASNVGEDQPLVSEVDVPMPKAAEDPGDSKDALEDDSKGERHVEDGTGNDQTPHDDSKAASRPGDDGSDSVVEGAAVCAKQNVPAASGPMCTKSVVATALSVRPGCYVDTIITPSARGTLTVPCNGDGPATLTFNGRSFTGSAVGGKVDVCADTKYEYPLIDDCTWLSAQRVTGSLAGGDLKFAYGEAPQRAKGRHCAPACTAGGSIRFAEESGQPINL